jgi:hypothetical protein
LYKVGNNEENKKTEKKINNLFTVFFILFYTVFKTVKKINNFFTVFLSGATAFGETGKSADLRKQKAVRRSQQ